jgi:hypothetical protein
VLHLVWLFVLDVLVRIVLLFHISEKLLLDAFTVGFSLLKFLVVCHLVELHKEIVVGLLDSVAHIVDFMVKLSLKARNGFCFHFIKL